MSCSDPSATHPPQFPQFSRQHHHQLPTFLSEAARVREELIGSVLAITRLITPRAPVVGESRKRLIAVLIRNLLINAQRFRLIAGQTRSIPAIFT